MEQYHSEYVMHVEDRRTRMLLLVLGHADTEHVVPAPCMALLQRPGGGGGAGRGGADRQMQSLNASGGHATRWDAAAHRTSRRPSPLCPPPVSMLRCRLAPGGRWAAAAAAQLRSSRNSAAQQHKFSSPLGKAKAPLVDQTGFSRVEGLLWGCLGVT